MFVHGIVGSQNLTEGLYFGISIFGVDLCTNTDAEVGSQGSLPLEIASPEISGTFRQLL